MFRLSLGLKKNDFGRRKLKIKTNQDFIRNYDFIKVNTIGREEGMVKRYIEAIVDLFRMGKEKKKYFLSKANTNPV